MISKQRDTNSERQQVAPEVVEFLEIAAESGLEPVEKNKNTKVMSVMSSHTSVTHKTLRQENCYLYDNKATSPELVQLVMPCVC